MQNYARKIRESKNMTLEQVADFLGKTKAQVSKMERGLTRLNMEWIDELSHLYRCSVHELIEDDKPVRIFPNKLSEKNKESSDFVHATFMGEIDARQSGIVEDVKLEEQYSLRFSPPKMSVDTELLAFNLNGDLLDEYKDGTQLVFAKLNESNKSLLKEGSIVICQQKDRAGRECGTFLRIIERNKYGFPYAVFKVRYSRNAFSTLTESLLAGKIGFEGLIEIYKEMDAGEPGKKVRKREIPLENDEMDIKAVLVKSIRDEV